MLGVTKYVSFFDGCWICWIAARAGPPLPNLGKFMVLMIDFLAIAAVTSWRRIVRCTVVRALGDGILVFDQSCAVFAGSLCVWCLAAMRSAVRSAVDPKENLASGLVRH